MQQIGIVLIISLLLAGMGAYLMAGFFYKRMLKAGFRYARLFQVIAFVLSLAGNTAAIATFILAQQS